jgi:hypothetical protein
MSCSPVLGFFASVLLNVVKFVFDFVNWLPVLRRSLKQTLDKKREGDFFVLDVSS